MTTNVPKLVAALLVALPASAFVMTSAQAGNSHARRDHGDRQIVSSFRVHGHARQHRHHEQRNHHSDRRHHGNHR